jgi:hypothetical protein
MDASMLVLLLLVPTAVWWYARKHTPRRTWLFTGAALGSVISPLSLGLYCTFTLVPLIGFFTGLIGLVSSIIHGQPGYELALWLGLVRPGVVVTGVPSLYVEVINGVVWAPAYGVLGFILDGELSRKARQGDHKPKPI